MTESAQTFDKVVAFIIELERLKQVNRMIKVKDTSRYENSAEHSWQVALLAISMLPYADKPIDGFKVVKMLLVHDIVEIDTGDKFAYDASHDDFDNEAKAAERIFALLPEETGSELKALWYEYEAKSTPEAEFAYGTDRLMPVFINLANNGQSWQEHGITKAQIIAKNSPAAKGCKQLWQYVLERLDKAQAEGWIA